MSGRVLHFSRHKASAAAALLVGLAAVIAFGTTIAARSNERPPSPRDEAPSNDYHVSSAEEALRRDAQHIASQRGWKIDATLARLRRQQRFDELSKELAADYPHVYGGDWLGDGPDARPFVRFASDNVPDGARSRADAHNLDVVFRPGANNSLPELKSRARSVHEDLVEHGHPEVVTAYSVRDQRIDATARRPPNSTKSDRELRSRLSKESRAPDVHITFVDRRVTNEDHAYGGLMIWDDSDNDGVRDSGEDRCTTGFAVTHDDGRSGVTTAGHCTSMDQIEEVDGDTFDTDGVTQHIGDFGDLEWHTTPHVEPAEFYSDWTTRRDVEDVEWESAIDEGDLYCQFGRVVSGKTCDEVYNESITVTKDDGTTLEDQTLMENDKAKGGDSGGPWFISTRAAGSHTGDALKADGTEGDYWGKAVDFDNALNIFPKTK